MINFDRNKWILFGKITLGFVAFVLILMLILPNFFKERTNKLVQDYLNEQISTSISFSDITLTFFRQFPSLTVSLDDVYIEGANNFERDTLLFSKELSFGLNLFSLFGESIQVKSIYLENAQINILRDERGNANFEIFESSEVAVEKESTESELKVDIQKIEIKSSDFLYQDTDLDFIALAENFDYSGDGDLKGNILSLNSNLEIDEFDLIYEGLAYIARKKIKARLRTIIDTESTALNFERNSLMINQMPVDFIGKLEFITGGYDMNFILESVDTNLKDIFSLVPEQMGPWLQKTRIRGKGDLRGSLSGLYLGLEGVFPDLILTLNIKDGLIRHQGAPQGIEKLLLDFGLTIPGLDFDRTRLDLDTLSFILGNGFVHSKFNIDGFDPAFVSGKSDVQLDLRTLDRALGIDAFEMRGDLAFNFFANGIYKTEWIPNTFRNPKYRTVSIPKFDLKTQLGNGFIQWKNRPIPLSDISWQLDVNSKDSLYQNIAIDLDRLTFKVLDQSFTGHFKVSNFRQLDIDAGLTGKLDLSNVPQIYPLEEGFDLKGQAIVDFKALGKYLPEQKTFPVTKTNISVHNGFIQTPYSEFPIKDINLILDVISSEGSFYDLKVDLEPFSFIFVDQEFKMTANLKNLDDIKYDVDSKGRIDIGKLYDAFAVEGYDVDGYLVTDFTLQGLQSDALKGRFSALNNTGTVDFEKVKLRADFLPEPFLVQHGRLRLEQDRIYLEDFKADYQRNEFNATGYLYNLTRYFVDENEILKGNLSLNSPELHIEDFLFYSADEAPKMDSLGKVQGVVMLPRDILFEFNAEAGQVYYDSMILENFRGNLKLDDGGLFLNRTGFDFIGTQFDMNGSYLPQNQFRANFDYDIKAKGFDIQRAYREFALFREMVPAAAYAEGVASLDYKISGSFDANMDPILPSIKGEGILGLDDIKLKGFRLMNSIARRTENNELEDPNLKQVQIKSSIENNLITIERTRMRIFGFRPRFEGQVSLDGDLSIAFRLGLPPFGIFGIPIKITGNAEDYQMEIGRITESDELEETMEGEVDIEESEIEEEEEEENEEEEGGRMKF